MKRLLHGLHARRNTGLQLLPQVLQAHHHYTQGTPAIQGVSSIKHPGKSASPVCVCVYLYYIYTYISVSSIYHWGVCPLRNWDAHPSKAKNPSIPFHPMLRSQLQRPAESPVPGCLNWGVHAQQKAARKAPEALLTDLAPKS